MGLVIDSGIILIMLITIIIGYKKGLIKVAINFIAIIASILVAIIIYKPIANQIIQNTEVDENIEQIIYEKIKNIDFENMPEKEKEENQILVFAQKNIEESIKKSKDNTAKYLSESLAQTIVEIGTFITTIIILRIVLSILNLLSSIIAEIPIIKQFNKSGGIIYGILEGLLIINIIFAICYIINPIYLNGKIDKNIQKSQLGKAIYENNIIINTFIK